jgi:hypothetical protein
MSKRTVFPWGVVLFYLALCLAQHIRVAAAIIVEGNGTPVFWRNHAILVVQIRHAPLKDATGHGTAVIPTNVIVICAAKMAVPTKLNFRCDFGLINMQSLVPSDSDILRGRLFLVCLYHDTDGIWDIQPDVMIGGCMPQQKAMYQLRSLHDPVIKAVENTVLKPGRHWRHWAYRVPGVSLHKVLAPAQPLEDAFTSETGSSQYFLTHDVVLVVRLEKILPKQYVSFEYPPFAQVLQVRILSKLAGKISVPRQLKLDIFWKSRDIGTVLPPRSQTKVGRLFVVVITKMYSTEEWEYWQIRPQTIMDFMPGKLAMVPIHNLSDPVLATIKRALAAARK